MRACVMLCVHGMWASAGKQRLMLQLSYCGQNVMQVQGVFDFEKRGLPANAKIHVDKNHSQLPPSSSSSSSQSMPGLTDYLFLRYARPFPLQPSVHTTRCSLPRATTDPSVSRRLNSTMDWHLTAIRLFVPYSMLASDGVNLGSWLTAKRVAQMCGVSPGTQSSPPGRMCTPPRTQRVASSLGLTFVTVCVFAWCRPLAGCSPPRCGTPAQATKARALCA
jgi:hypothetical protein